MENPRRQFLQWTAGLGAASLLPKVAAAASPATFNVRQRLQGVVCRPTVAQTEGPFYPVDRQLDEDTDLTYVRGRSGKAQGQVVYVHGTVVGTDCLPVAGAMVEIWQACVSGKYNHPNDPNTAPLDPNFQYWGRAITDNAGKFVFKTIIPGAYPAGQGWVRPPHIHFKVAKLGYQELTTQMYFAGHKLNAQDLILRGLPVQDQAGVLVQFQQVPAGYQPGSLRGHFNISLVKVR